MTPLVNPEKPPRPAPNDRVAAERDPATRQRAEDRWPCDAASARALELERVVWLLQSLACTDLGEERFARWLPVAERDVDAAALSEVESVQAKLGHDLREPRAERSRWDAAPGRRALGLALLEVLGDQELVRPLRADSVAGVSGAATGLGDSSLAVLQRALRDRSVSLDGPRLVRLAEFARLISGAVARLRQASDEELETFLDHWQLDAETLAEFAHAVSSSLDEQGEVRAEATPKLRSLSQKLQSARRRLYRDFESYVQTHNEQLAEETLSSRDGRLTVLLAAGNRGRLSGLHHGRSATGKSFYFEPLELVEANNEVQEMRSEEQAERQRILLELASKARHLQADFLSAIECWACLDEQQAIARYARAAEARYVEPTPLEDGLRIVGGRHPLLDPRLRAVRRRALGDGGHEGDIVPLHLELTAARVVVVTGPNAGGKTVALKTVGLLSLLQAMGLPLPCDEDSLLPEFRHVVAVVGDEQDLLRDRSTFSARLLRLRKVWHIAEDGPGALVLLDEIGSGTNPQEGSALAEPLLERLVACGTFAVLTTHLVDLAARAHELEGSLSAGMEFDLEAQEPRFRVRFGPPTGSQALSLARRLGLPPEWLSAAQERLDDEYRSLLSLLEEVENERAAVQSERQQLQTLRADQQILNRRLTEREGELREQAKTLRARLDQRLRELRGELAERLAEEVQRLESEVAAKLERWREQSAGEPSAKARQVIGSAAQRSLVSRVMEPTHTLGQDVLPESVSEGETGAVPDEVGQEVLHRGLGWGGVLASISGKRAVVRVAGKKVHCTLDELTLAAPEVAHRAPSTRRRQKPAVPVRSGHRSEETREPVGPELHLIGQRVEPALEALDRYLDRALLAGHESVRVVHGHGTGRLREAVRRHLNAHPVALEHQAAEARHGGNGATVVRLRRGDAS